jgi:hypothetical protein
MKTTILSLTALVILLLCGTAHADYAAEIPFQNVYVQDNLCYVQSIADVSNTCSFYSYRFKFNTSTSQGKAMLSVVLMAKALNKKISVWYNKSSAVGTNETNGCTTATMAEAIGVALN